MSEWIRFWVARLIVEGFIFAALVVVVIVFLWWANRKKVPR